MAMWAQQRAPSPRLTQAPPSGSLTSRAPGPRGTTPRGPQQMTRRVSSIALPQKRASLASSVTGTSSFLDDRLNLRLGAGSLGQRLQAQQGMEPPSGAMTHRASPRSSRAHPYSAAALAERYDSEDSDVLEQDFQSMQKQVERLWEEVAVPRPDRDYFRKEFLSEASVSNISALQTELGVLSEYQKRYNEVHRRVQVRESHLNSLAQLVAKYDPRFYRKEAVKVELDRIVASIREATLHVINALMRWKACLNRSLGFQYKDSTSYCQKMFSDLQFIKDTPLAIIMGISVVNNPLLLSPKLTLVLGEALAQTKQRLPHVFASYQGRTPGRLFRQERQQRYAELREQFRGIVGFEGHEANFESLLLLHVMVDNERATQAMPREKLFLLSGTPAFARRLATSLWSTFVAYRERREQNQAMLEHESSTMIQSFWRGVRARQNYRANRRIYLAALRAQVWWRGTQSRSALRRQWLAATDIQAVWRMFLARWHCRELLMQYRAAVRVQSAVRYALSKCLMEAIRRRAHCCCVVQQACRCVLAQRQVLGHRNRQRLACVIQAHCRAFLLRKRTASVIRLQCWARQEAARREAQYRRRRVE
eukprot:RCo043055